MFNFVFLCPKRWFLFNSRIVRTHFSSIMSLNNWKMIPETRSHIFRWRFRCRPSTSSLLRLPISFNSSWKSHFILSLNVWSFLLLKNHSNVSLLYSFHRRCKNSPTISVMASRFWLAAYLVRLFHFLFWLVYFSGLKHILACQISTF